MVWQFQFINFHARINCQFGGVSMFFFFLFFFWNIGGNARRKRGRFFIFRAIFRYPNGLGEENGIIFPDHRPDFPPVFHIVSTRSMVAIRITIATRGGERLPKVGNSALHSRLVFAFGWLAKENYVSFDTIRFRPRHR